MVEKRKINSKRDFIKIPKKTIRQEFFSVLERGSIALYGYCFPSYISSSKNGRVSLNQNFFYSTSKRQKRPRFISQFNEYESYFDVGKHTNDIIILDQSSIKSLLKGFPTTSKYILLSLNNIKYFPTIIIGLLRRLYCRQIKVHGVCTLNHLDGFKSNWLIFDS